MKILIYLEGPSDVYCMKTLFGSIVAEREKQGVKIDFLPFKMKGSKETTGKEGLINKGVVRAISIVSNDPCAIVALVPDLYPKNKGGPHETPEELFELIKTKFKAEIKKRNLSTREQELTSRFFTFCFKHDLEVLLLAVPDRLAKRLEVNPENLKGRWIESVEDQDHDHPPKEIIERLFDDYKKSYKDTQDAPAILNNVSPDDLSERCPQCFKPLAEFIADYTGRA